MKLDYTIRLENETDFREVETLVREAFWNVYRPGCLEHYVLHEFRRREDFVRPLSFLLEQDGQIVGYIMYARSAIVQDGVSHSVLTFGPFCISPAKQGKGYGRALLAYSMNEAKRLGAKAIAITGNPDYYKKSGFVVAKEVDIRYADDPNADYFLVKELRSGFLKRLKNGVYKDPDGYFVDEKKAELFDKTFPFKEKKKTDTQLF